MRWPRDFLFFFFEGTGGKWLRGALGGEACRRRCGGGGGDEPYLRLGGGGELLRRL